MNVLITGSSNGLGRCLAWQFAKPENTLILHGRNGDRLSAFCSLLNKDHGTRAEMVLGDIRSEITKTWLYSAALRNDIDVLINNAGIYQHGDPGKISPDELDAVIEINLIAPIRLALLIYPIMAARGSGRIVNLNSLAGREFNDREAAYCASKWGLRGFMGSFRHEARKHGVSVLDVYPGAMQTDMMLDRSGYDDMMDPDDVAEVIAGLCQHDADSLSVNEIEIGRR